MSTTDEPDKTAPPDEEATFLAGHEPEDLPEPKQAEETSSCVLAPHPRGSRRRRTVPREQAEPRAKLTSRDRLLLPDAWTRSGLSAEDFASLTIVSAHSLYAWRKKFEEFGPAGLEERRREGQIECA